jgi:hypothetical protein
VSPTTAGSLRTTVLWVFGYANAHFSLSFLTFPGSIRCSAAAYREPTRSFVKVGQSPSDVDTSAAEPLLTRPADSTIAAPSAASPRDNTPHTP